MTFDEMMSSCKAGGKARRHSWTSDAIIFVEGYRLGCMTRSGGRLRISEYTATITDREATDWERVGHNDIG